MRCALMPVICGVALLIQSSVWAQQCPIDSIGLDRVYGESGSQAALGEGVGEVFYAPDTLVSFLRVWRLANEWNSLVGMHLWIVGTRPDTVPDTRNVIKDAGTLVNNQGDGINPTPFTWEFDPPLRLPSRGYYAFFIFAIPCGSFCTILATQASAYYYDGFIWYTDRGCDLHPGIGLNRYRPADQCFTIGFCTDAVTPTHPKSWGELKRRFRETGRLPRGPD